jgi:hypothetical protein
MTEPTVVQIFCSVADLVADMQTPGGDEALLYQKCRDASDYLVKEIGEFIPITDTKHVDGNQKTKLPIPPFTTISSVVNYKTNVSITTDYTTQPEFRKWPYGPFTWLEVVPNGKIFYWGTGFLEGSWFDTKAIAISGHRGLYERSQDSGANVGAGNQDNVQVTLPVDNGGNVSPGMILLIDTEQELVTSWAAPIDSTTTLNGAIANPTIQTFTLTDGTKVNIGEIIRLDFEQMKVLDKQGNSIYVARGWSRTAAVTHLTGIAAFVYRTVNVQRAINGTTIAAHTAPADILRYMVPDDILFLTKEIATLMLNKSKSGYQGRTGGDQGVIFYNDAFPKQDVDRIKALYRIVEE